MNNHRTMKNIHTFESFLSAGEALHETSIHSPGLSSDNYKIDASKLKNTDGISIHVPGWLSKGPGNPDTELAKEFGDDLVIPGRRKGRNAFVGGEVTWKGERIGYVDPVDFGTRSKRLVFTDLDWVADHLEALNRVVAKTGFLYTRL